MSLYGIISTCSFNRSSKVCWITGCHQIGLQSPASVTHQHWCCRLVQAYYIFSYHNQIFVLEGNVQPIPVLGHEYEWEAPTKYVYKDRSLASQSCLCATYSIYLQLAIGCCILLIATSFLKMDSMQVALVVVFLPKTCESVSLALQARWHHLQLVLYSDVSLVTIMWCWWCVHKQIGINYCGTHGNCGGFCVVLVVIMV